MPKTARARHTLKLKQQTARLVDNKQRIAAVARMHARTLGMVDQTLFNWVKVHRQGKLKGVTVGV